MEFLKHLRNGGKGTVILLLAVLGGLMLLFSSATKQKQTEISDLVPSAAEKEMLERELTDLILQMEGVSQVKVSVSLESGNEYVWQNGKNTLILAGRVRGVAVVCDGAADGAVKGRIISMLCALFDLPIKSVSVSQ